MKKQVIKHKANTKNKANTKHKANTKNKDNTKNTNNEMKQPTAQPTLTVPQNKIFTIRPYWLNGLWVFDEPRLGLKAELFVETASACISRMLKKAGIKNAKSGFNLIFSTEWFPDFTARVVRLPDDQQSPAGTMYHWPEENMELWLCGVLNLYVNPSPQAIYVKVQSLNN